MEEGYNLGGSYSESQITQSWDMRLLYLLCVSRHPVSVILVLTQSRTYSTNL